MFFFCMEFMELIWILYVFFLYGILMELIWILYVFFVWNFDGIDMDFIFFCMEF